MNRQELLHHLRLRLLRGRAWRFSRYTNLRDAVVRLQDELSTIAVVGAGHGIAELAIAVEFPQLNITLTDVNMPGSPTYIGAMEMCWRNDIDNVQFAIWNALEPTHRRFDLVCSTEMIEHVPDAPLAAKHMREASSKYVYCLAPFSGMATNLIPERREKAWHSLTHYVLGYDALGMESLFGQPILIAGTYWRENGAALRALMKTLTDDEVVSRYDELVELGMSDIRDEIPNNVPEAWGIKIIARHDAPMPAKPMLPPDLGQLLGGKIPKREKPKPKPKKVPA